MIETSVEPTVGRLRAVIDTSVEPTVGRLRAMIDTPVEPTVGRLRAMIDTSVEPTVGRLRAMGDVQAVGAEEQPTNGRLYGRGHAVAMVQNDLAFCSVSYTALFASSASQPRPAAVAAGKSTVWPQTVVGCAQ